ncbi:MAG: HDOD domain-containing protein [Planctomycetota bacterium]
MAVALERITREIESLPTLPEVYTTVSRMLENPKVSASDIAEVISRDPAITAKLLKIVNSAFYGLPQQVSTLTHALVLLGFSTVKSLLLATSLTQVFGKAGTDRFDRPAFWTHCFATGLVAKSIAIRIGYVKVEEMFIQGLLHDIGKIVLDQYAPDEFAAVLAAAEEERILLREAEERLLGFDHSEVGALVAKRWNFPPHFAHSIGRHHRPRTADRLLQEASMVHLADIVCRAKQIGYGGDPCIPALSALAWKALNLDWKAFVVVMEEAGALEEGADVFQ